MKSLFPFQNLHKIALHIDVNVAVAVEGTAAFGMAGEGWDKVRVLGQLVDVTYEGTAGHVAAGDLIGLDLHICSVYCT